MARRRDQASRTRERDHALALQRFVGGVQVFGGATLALAYALGAVSLHTDLAQPALVALGALQASLGLVWLLRPRTFRAIALRRPGVLTAFALGAAAAVAALGGSGVDRVYITSVQCWLIAAGYSLPGMRRWAAGLALTAAVVLPVWAAVDAGRAGFHEDGQLLTAALGLLASVGAGLWMGRTTGNAARTLARWHVVEVHELGVVRRLRQQLAAVETAAHALADRLGDRAGRPELEGLTGRLRQGLAGVPDQGAVPLAELLGRVTADHAARRSGTRLVVDAGGNGEQVVLAPVVADAAQNVLARQLDNVVRHAPGAKTVTLGVAVQRGVLTLTLEDDGDGDLPFRAGTGTRWSERQLGRVGGSARYYAGDRGVGFRVEVPVSGAVAGTAVDGLSVDRALTDFSAGMLGAVRWAGYIGDSLSAHAEASTLGAWWLLMPLGAVLIELVLRGALPGGRNPSTQRLLAASVLSAGLAAAFVHLHGSPAALIPATTSVIVPAHLVYAGTARQWAAAELLRLAAVLPMLLRDPAAGLGLLVIYPAGLYLIVRALRRFSNRARGLEQRAADALGRAGLAAATMRGLSLQHDALDVLARTSALDGRVDAAARDLESAVTALTAATTLSLDPREVVTTGIGAAVDGAVRIDPAPGARGPAEGGAVTPVGAIDRITLIELAGLAADERASCAPPGLLGRRRLRELTVGWEDDGDAVRVAVAAEPTLQPPDGRCVARVQAVAETLGIDVESTPKALRLVAYRR